MSNVTKKELRKLRNDLEKAARAVIKAANEREDAIAELGLEPFRNFDRNGLKAKIAYKKFEALTKAEREWAFDLLKRNMKVHYENAEPGGWKDGEKRREMSSDDSRFLIAREVVTGGEGTSAQGAVADPEGALIGFVHLQFVMENELESLYVYEIQSEPRIQRKGLGRHFMSICELIARKSKLRAVHLTVFKDNNEAVNFYIKKMRYDISNHSPEEEECSYYILCKVFDMPPHLVAPPASK
eukprot:tig00021569_g22342.t1